MEEPIQISCPWCGEPIDTFFDWSAGNQQYTEDCQVCCRPINMVFHVGPDGEMTVEVDRE
ncbi:MAG: CPXCG motif-containing cysteine-rich protein [Oligoflexus sp.]